MVVPLLPTSRLKAHPDPESAPTVADDMDAPQPPQDDAGFPDQPEPSPIGRHGLQQLDLLMTTLEALDLNCGEVMVASLQEKEATADAMDRVEFWKWRTTNPLRRTMRRNQLNQAQVMTMVGLVCDMAARVYPLLHRLVSVREDPSVNDTRWKLLTRRLQDMIQQRMNPKRVAMQSFADDDHALATTRTMVRALIFSAGPGGEQRLLASLQDGMRS